MLLLEENKEEKVEKLSDEEVLSLSISKPENFEILINRYQENFLRKAQSILYIREDAEDVVQETFTKIYLNANKFQKIEGASFKSWAYKILVNTAFSHLERSKRKRTQAVRINDEIENNAIDHDVDLSLEKKELTDYIARIMTEIPKTFANILHLQFMNGMTMQEIAEVESISAGTARVRAFRAKREFRRIGEFFE